MTPYLIDSNIFIGAKNRYYAFSICPGFWDSLIGHHELEKVYSIDYVREELLRGHDDLADWVRKKMPSTFFLSTQDEVVRKTYKEIMLWVQRNPQFYDAAKVKFATEADGWLAAYAKAYGGYTVVTEEQPSPAAKRRVPLPNVCEQFGVQYQDVFQMLLDLNIKFIWK